MLVVGPAAMLEAHRASVQMHERVQRAICWSAAGHSVVLVKQSMRDREVPSTLNLGNWQRGTQSAEAAPCTYYSICLLYTSDAADE